MIVKCFDCGLFNREIPDEDFVEGSNYICRSCADKLIAEAGIPVDPVEPATKEQNTVTKGDV